MLSSKGDNIIAHPENVRKLEPSPVKDDLKSRCTQPSLLMYPGHKDTAEKFNPQVKRMHPDRCQFANSAIKNAPRPFSAV